MSYPLSSAYLYFFRGKVPLLHLKIDKVEFLMGRGMTNDVVVPDPSVPELAARLIVRGDEQYELQDISGGLIRLNGAAPKDHYMPVRFGDAIQLGVYTLILDRWWRKMDRERSRQTRRMSEPHFERGFSSSAWLRWQERFIELRTDQTFSIGSEADNDLVLQDGFVSGYHCQILYMDSGWRITDLHSTNGTRVNGLKVQHAELRQGVTIDVGSASLGFAQNRDEIPASTHGMIAESPAMRGVFRLVERFAESQEPVVVLGESGTGKEGISRALHDASSRAEAPYIALNCGALAASIIESELFGHVKGAFTGALTDKKGAFEEASGGTLFLDEIGELPLELQPKLLRVLETQRVRRLGSTTEIPIKTRIVAATHRNLVNSIAAGRFRQDLFHRLYVLIVEIPPLRERPEDVRALIRHFLQLDTTIPPRALSEDALGGLLAHTWPGNVRELRNVIVRALLISEGSLLTAQDLHFSGEAFNSAAKGSAEGVTTDAVERARMVAALEQSGGNRAAAARSLGVSKSTFYDRMRRMGL
ncbi:MAG: sigma 54-interacting transcriptional regulator [Myxococcales bacterium]|nr:sigma 54-interacting transcriptional regulator [Myxococcales bacterium]